ncbi:MAG: DUF6502 family protein [Myxococcota bacterium]|jgi:hypothetical protein|nr:DUF6502 family protein [Myxococcota bacterium]
MSGEQNEIPSVPGPPERLTSAARLLLRPLVHLLLSRQITFPILSQWLKEIYVEVARGEFAIEGKRLTDSRVNLLTGIHRKDVKRLREEPSETGAEERPRSLTLGAQIVARWTDLPEYQDEHGHPRPLPRRPVAGETSFEDLVASVSRDIRPRSVLDEWQRLGVASLDAADRVVLNADAFIPSKSFEEKAYSLGHTLHDHIAAGAHNLLDREPPMMERSVFYASLTDASVRELLELAETRGMESLHEVNRRAMELQERDTGDKGAVHRMRFGIYSFRAKRGDGDYGD